MKTSTKDQLTGSFHEMKGAIKKGVAKITNDRNLKAEGVAETKAGKVQQRMGRATVRPEEDIGLSGVIGRIEKIEGTPFSTNDNAMQGSRWKYSPAASSL